MSNQKFGSWNTMIENIVLIFLTNILLNFLLLDNVYELRFSKIK